MVIGRVIIQYFWHFDSWNYENNFIPFNTILPGYKKTSYTCKLPVGYYYGLSRTHVIFHYIYKVGYRLHKECWNIYIFWDILWESDHRLAIVICRIYWYEIQKTFPIWKKNVINKWLADSFDSWTTSILGS